MYKNIISVIINDSLSVHILPNSRRGPSVH